MYLEEVDCLVHNVLVLLSDGGGAPGTALGGLLEWHDGHLADGLARGGQAGVERRHLGVFIYNLSIEFTITTSREFLSYQVSSGLGL